jgi:hypothetical protein
MSDFSLFNVTCHQSNCFNFEQTIAINAVTDSPNVICGPCGNEITDIQPVNLDTETTQE